jgi:hypothetical protein
MGVWAALRLQPARLAGSLACCCCWNKAAAFIKGEQARIYILEDCGGSLLLQSCSPENPKKKARQGQNCVTAFSPYSSEANLECFLWQERLFES